MFRQRIAEEIRSSVNSRFKKDVERYIDEMVENVMASSMTPIEASQEILKRLLV